MLLGLLELAGNHVLEYDPETLAKLQKLHGKTIAIEIKNLQARLFFTPEKEGIDLATEIDGNADVTLKTTLRALLKISHYGLEEAELDTGELEISGDAITGQRFASLLTNLNIDWEELLAEKIGDSPARFATKTSNKLSELLTETGDTLKMNLRNLITEELGITATKTDVDAFLDDVDILRADTDRLFARIKRLQDQMTKG